MTFVFEKAKEGYDERLALFSVPPVETAIESIYYKDYRPTGTISDKSTLEFDVQNSSSDYIILNQIALILTLQIFKDGVKITDSDKVGLVNFPSASIFRQIDLAIQHKTISTGVGNNYPYKAMLDILLRKGLNEQLTYLALGGFHKDTAGSPMDNASPERSLNAGLGARFKRTKGGAEAMYKTRIFSDICQQNRFLLDNVPINIKFLPSSHKFALMYENADGVTYTVHIKDASLVVPFAKLSPRMLTAHGESLKSEMALYPFTRSEVKVFNISSGSFAWTVDNIFLDSIPKRMVLGFISQESYSGDNTKNPFNFTNFALNYLDFQIDGQSCGGQVLQPNYTANNYVHEYAKIFEATPYFQKEPPNITYEEFKEGYCLYVFDLEKSKDPNFTNPLRRGQSRLIAKFKDALTAPITAIVYGSFESVMKVDEARNVMVES